MHKTVFVLLAGLFVIAQVYGLDAETEGQMITVYNLTRNLYIDVFGLLDDYDNKTVEPGFAEKKLVSWKTEYNKKTDLIPQALDKLRELMNKVIDVVQKIIHENRPKSQKTKDWLAELDTLRANLVLEMKQVRYSLR